MWKILSVKDLERDLGLSRAATWNRIRAIRPLLKEKGCIKRGNNNSLLINGEGVELLRVLQKRCAAGATLKQAATQLINEAGCLSQDKMETDPLAMQVAMLRNQVNALEARVSQLNREYEPHLQELARVLRGVV